MNKKQLIAKVRRHMGTGTTYSTASAAVEAVLSSILSAVREEKVHISHFGTFEHTTRPTRQGFDINTGAMTSFPARTKLIFRPSKGFVPGQS